MANFLKKNEVKSETTVAPPTSLAPVVHYKSPIDLLYTLDRRSLLAGLRSLTGAIQFTMINTADWIVRREDMAAAGGSPSLDERNAADEFSRGQDHVDDVGREFGNEPLQTPEAKLKQYSHLYYGLVDAIRTLEPKPFERPKGLLQTLEEFVPRGVGLSDDTLALLAAAESEPGEFVKARDEGKARKMQQMATRKPRIKELLDLNADCMPLIDTFDELPVHTRLRLATAAWKGVYYSRKSLVTYIGTYNNLDDLAAVVAMAKDLDIIAKFCEQFEDENRQVLDLMVEAGVQVYGIEDARKDVKRARGN